MAGVGLPWPTVPAGVVLVEAPRGVLIHHYKTDSKGIVQKVNLIVATAHNYPAMNMSVSMRQPMTHGANT